MQKQFQYLLLLFLLIAFTSCNLEKRIYRNGWYSTRCGNNSCTKIPPIAEFRSGNETKTDSSATQRNLSPTIVPHEVGQETILGHTKLVETKQGIQDGDTSYYNTPKKSRHTRMTYDNAIESIGRKGGVPQKAAKTVYLLSVLSIIGCLIGFGWILAVIALVYAPFAKKKVELQGKCVEENLAIIRIGQQISLTVLIVLSTLFALFAFFMLVFFPRINGY